MGECESIYYMATRFADQTHIFRYGGCVFGFSCRTAYVATATKYTEDISDSTLEFGMVSGEVNLGIPFDLIFYERDDEKTLVSRIYFENISRNLCVSNTENIPNVYSEEDIFYYLSYCSALSSFCGHSARRYLEKAMLQLITSSNIKNNIAPNINLRKLMSSLIKVSCANNRIKCRSVVTPEDLAESIN